MERARRVQDARIEAIRALAKARQEVTDARERAAREIAELQARHAEQLRSLEDEDIKEYPAATSAGWTPEYLRKIGYDAPDKVTRVRRRAAKKTASPTAAGSAPSEPAASTENPGQEHS